MSTYPSSISLTFTLGFMVFVSNKSIIIALKYSVFISSLILISNCTATMSPYLGFSWRVLKDEIVRNYIIKVFQEYLPRILIRIKHIELMINRRSMIFYIRPMFIIV